MLLFYKPISQLFLQTVFGNRYLAEGVDNSTEKQDGEALLHIKVPHILPGNLELFQPPLHAPVEILNGRAIPAMKISMQPPFPGSIVPFNGWTINPMTVPPIKPLFRSAVVFQSRAVLTMKLTIKPPFLISVGIFLGRASVSVGQTIQKPFGIPTGILDCRTVGSMKFVIHPPFGIPIGRYNCRASNPMTFPVQPPLHRTVLKHDRRTILAVELTIGISPHLVIPIPRVHGFEFIKPQFYKMFTNYFLHMILGNVDFAMGV